MNTFGNIFRLTTFGESHGDCVGGVVDGMPSGIVVDMDFLQNELNRRRPGSGMYDSQRHEPDEVRLLSGVFEGRTTGAPIAFVVDNTDHRSADYEHLRSVYRPSHADYVYDKKYSVRDFRGGGRSSARVLVSRVVAGALAKMVLRERNISIEAYTWQIGDVALTADYTHYDLQKADNNMLHCPDETLAGEMISRLEAVRRDGDSIGGVVMCVVRGCPLGLGEPEFGKLHASLASAVMSINACRAFEIGDGWQMARSKGSKMNDALIAETDETGVRIKTLTNHSGGIQGGISNGEDIFFRAAFKPIPTIMHEQTTVDVCGNATTLAARGRHDVCVIPRVLPIVESMTAMTLLDFLLITEGKR